MDIETLRYIVGSLFAAVAYLHLQLFRCRSDHAELHRNVSVLRADVAGLKGQIDALD